MFRTAASLIAKKTAIVAITGVTVIGGATFALAEIGQPPGEDGVCDVNEVVGADGLCAADLDGDGIADPVEPAPCVEDENTTETECPVEPAPCVEDDTTTETECPVEEPVSCDDETTADIVEECPTEEPVSCDDETTADIVEECPTEELAPVEEELVAEHPENHGKYVSEAAKGGGDCAGLTGRDKGQCVSTVARSDAGKPAAEAPAEEEPAADEPVEEPATVTAAAPKGKPADAGPPAGKGGGKKG